MSFTGGINNLTIAGGDSTHGVGVTLGALTFSNGSIANFASPTVDTTSSTTNGFATTNTLTNGILGGDILVNDTDFATITGGVIAAYGSYTNINTNGSAIASGAATNVKINTATGTGNDSLAASGVTSINSLLQGTATASTIGIGSGNTLNFGTNAGILVNTNAAGTGNLTIGATAGDGSTVTAGGSTVNTAGTIYLTNLSSGAALTINAIVADNGSGKTSLVTNGAVFLNGANTYTGTTTIANGSTLTYGSSLSQTLSGAIGGTGTLTDVGTGTLVLSNAANTYTGGTNVSGGTLALGNTSGFASTNAITVGTGGTLQIGNLSSAASTSSFDLIFTGTGSVTDGTGGHGATLTLTSTQNGTTTPQGDAIQLATGVTGNDWIRCDRFLTTLEQRRLYWWG